MDLFFQVAANYFGYFMIMIILGIVAIVCAKKRIAWILYVVGAVVQLLSLLGQQKSAGYYGYNMAMYWFIYFVLLITLAVLINVRKNSTQRKSEHTPVEKPKGLPESIDKDAQSALDTAAETVLHEEKAERQNNKIGSFWASMRTKRRKLEATVEGHDSKKSDVPGGKRDFKWVKWKEKAHNHHEDAVDSNVQKGNTCEKQEPKGRKKILLIVVLVGLVVSIIINVFQALSITELKNENGFLSEVKTAVSELCGNVNIGKVSDDFGIGEGVVVLHADGSKRELLLTAKGGRNRRLSYALSDMNVANVEVKEQDYRTSKVTITPKEKGATIVTFSNSYDNKMFKVLVIVVD